jgi:uncharacterized protein (DUF488 family)
MPDKMVKNLFTIGHSNHSLERFLELIKSQGIGSVIDVRSAPYSRYCPQYNKDALDKSLKSRGIEYIFLGKELGARRSEENCYVDGKVKFEHTAKLPIFQNGLQQVLNEIKNHKSALMCAESEPLNCHRTILVCRQLKKINPDLEITHILSDGTTESHEQTLQRLIRLHKLEPELFGELSSNSDLIEKAYDLQANKISFHKAENKV